MVEQHGYVFKYAVNRQVMISGIAPDDIDDCFRVLQETFGTDWLSAENGQNVVQRLWNERYYLSTVELYSLGHAIRTMKAIDKKFVDDKVALIKTNDSKNINGAVFEILAMNMFALANPVKPAKENQAGYDGLVMPADKTIRLSIKNYSISKHQESFMHYCEQVNNLVTSYLNEFDSPPLEIFIHKKIGYPSASDWQQLIDNLHGVFIEYNKMGKHFVRMEMGDWSITVQGLIVEGETFAKVKKSYTLIMSSQFHKNEEKNLFDKLEEACVNLAKHETVESVDEKNFIIIHLPSIADRKNCEKWVKDYFDMFPDKPISCVILLQPMVATDPVKKGTYISMGISFIHRDQLMKDFSDILPLQFTFPIGIPQTDYLKHIIMMRETAETAFEIHMENCYVFQCGHHYVDAKPTDDGGIEGSVNKVASGVFTHSVFTINGESMVISGHFEPMDMLELL